MRLQARVAITGVLLASNAAAEPTADAPRPANTGFLFDTHVGIPSVAGGGINVIGQAKLGYQSEHWGGVADGSLAAYGKLTKVALQTTRKSTAAGNFWGNWGDPEAYLQLRGDFGYAGYFSRRTALDTSLDQLTQRSIMGRFNGLVGAHFQPRSGQYGTDVWAGAGAQVEGYAITEGRALALPASVDVKGTFTASVTAKLRAFAFVGSFGLARLESDFIYFRITRASASLDLDVKLAPTGDLTRSFQIDAENKLYFDVLAAEVLGFIPLVHGGLDVYYNWAGDGGPRTTSVVPSGGVGVRREAF